MTVKEPEVKKVLLELPVFLEPLTNAEVAAGSELVLRCRVAGKPIPEIVWIQNNVPVNTKKSVSLRDRRISAFFVLSDYMDHIE